MEKETEHKPSENDIDKLVQDYHNAVKEKNWRVVDNIRKIFSFYKISLFKEITRRKYK